MISCVKRIALGHVSVKMIKAFRFSNLPISWQLPYRHISQPVRPTWLFEPAARGPPFWLEMNVSVRRRDLKGVFLLLFF